MAARACRCDAGAAQAGGRADDVLSISSLSSGCGPGHPHGRVRAPAADLHLRIGVRHAAYGRHDDWGPSGCTGADAVRAAVPVGLPGVHLPDPAGAVNPVVGRHGLDIAPLLARADEETDGGLTGA